MSKLEIAANVVNGISVFLAARNHVRTWPIGIIGCILFAWMFFEAKLYADVTLQFFFVFTSIYGWYHWNKGGMNQHEKPITFANAKAVLIYCFIGVATAMLYGALLYSLTDASYPFIDSIILTFSIIAQLLLMKRQFQNWYFWIVVNLIAVPLYAVKDLYLTSAIYFLFLINAVLGIKTWRDEMSRASK